MHRKIGEVMHRGVVTCKVNARVDEVVKIMAENKVSVVVVTDERLDACGVVTDTDLVKCYGKDLSAITAEDVMTPKLLTASLNTLIHEAVQQMLIHKVHQLIIVSEGGVHHRPVGIFTVADAVALMAGESGQRQ